MLTVSGPQPNGRSRAGNTGITFDDMRPGYYDPAARLAEMDANGVEASLCFPNIDQIVV
jgi:hypothetical protein